MDGSRFDALARSLADRTSRRGVLGGLAALATGLAGVRTTAAQTACPPEEVYRRGLGCVCKTTGRPRLGQFCPCPRGTERCGPACLGSANYRSDPANCGACGVVCDTGAGQACVVGECCVPSNGPSGSCAAHEDCCGTDVCGGIQVCIPCTPAGQQCSSVNPCCDGLPCAGASPVGYCGCVPREAPSGSCQTSDDCCGTDICSSVQSCIPCVPSGEQCTDFTPCCAGLTCNSSPIGTCV